MFNVFFSGIISIKQHSATMVPGNSSYARCE